MRRKSTKPRTAWLLLPAMVLGVAVFCWLVPGWPDRFASGMPAADTTPGNAAAVADSTAATEPPGLHAAETRSARPASTEVADAPQDTDFETMVERLVAIYLTARDVAANGDESELQRLDESGRPILERILMHVEEPAGRALHELTGMLSEDTTPRSLARRQVYLAVIRLGLARMLSVLEAGGSRTPIDQLVNNLLSCVPQDELLASELSELLIGKKYLGVAHENRVLDLVAAAAEERFLIPMVTGLLDTLWKNLRATGARTQAELIHLALLFRGDANPAKRAVALKHLMVVDDGRYRELVIRELLANRDDDLVAEMTMTVATELPPKIAMRTLERLSLVTTRQLMPAFLALGVRDAKLLVDTYEQKLADGTRPDYRAELVTGAAFQNQAAGLRIAKLAFANDPDPEVRARAMYALTSQPDATEGERVLTAALADPAFGENPTRLGAVVMALENLVAAGDPNAILRIGQRLLGNAALLPGDRQRVARILKRCVPDHGGR